MTKYTSAVKSTKNDFRQLFKLRVILRSRVSRGVCPREGYSLVLRTDTVTPALRGTNETCVEFSMHQTIGVTV